MYHRSLSPDLFVNIILVKLGTHPPLLLFLDIQFSLLVS